MVDDLILPAKIVVFMRQHIKAVRANRDDLVELVVAQRLDVRLGHHLKQKLVARPARRITRALFLLAQNGEINPRLLQQAGHRAGDLLGPIIERRRAPPPEHRGGERDHEPGVRQGEGADAAFTH